MHHDFAKSPVGDKLASGFQRGEAKLSDYTRRRRGAGRLGEYGRCGRRWLRMRRPLCVLAAVTALVSAARAEPARTMTTTAMAGPYAVAFESRCVERVVDRAEPAREVTCERVRSSRIAGHRVAIVRTVEGGWEHYWVAIETEVGWFRSKRAIAIPVSGGNGTGTIWREGAADEPVVRGAWLAGRPVVMADVASTLTAGCTVCEPPHRPTTMRRTDTMVCQIGPVGVSCADPLELAGNAPRVHVRTNTLVIDGDTGDPALPRGRYTLALSAPEPVAAEAESAPGAPPP